MRAPYYRIVVMDARSKRDGRAIEEIGKYHPTEEPSYIEVDTDRAQYWLGVGAQPTDTARSLLRKAGVLKRRHELRLGRTLSAKAVPISEKTGEEAAG